MLIETVPPPTYEPDHPLQMLVTNLDASPYLGRLALCRIVQGEIKRGQTVAWCRIDGTVETREARRALHDRGPRAGAGRRRRAGRHRRRGRAWPTS